MDYFETIKNIDNTRRSLEVIKNVLGYKTYSELKEACETILKGINYLEENA